LIARNLPKSLNEEDVLEIFNSFGVVVGIEMLFKDNKIEELLKHKRD